MGLLAFVVIGVLVGLLIRAVAAVAADESSGTLLMTVAAMVGALVGGVLVALLVGVDPLAQFFIPAAWGGAAAGAVVFDAVYLLISEPGGA